MRITAKGQVTIPKEWREKLGFLPVTEVEFIPDGNALKLIKKKTASGRGLRLVEHLRRKATVKMTTDEIMALTRGENSVK